VLNIRSEITDINDNLITSATNTVTFSVYSGGILRSEIQGVVVNSVNGVAGFDYQDSVGGLMKIKAVAAGLQDGTIEIVNMIDKSIGGLYMFPDSNTSIQIPAWAIDQNIKIEASSITMTGVDLTGVDVVNSSLRRFVIKDENDNVVRIDKFNKPFAITINYQQYLSYMGTVNENKLKIFLTHGGEYSAGSYSAASFGKLDWIRESTVNQANKTITAQMDTLAYPIILGMYKDARDLLFQSYPNPFSPARDGYTRIEFMAGTSSRVTLKIYNIALEPVRTIVDKDVLNDINFADWDGRNDSGDLVADGVYLCQVVTSSFKSIIKIVVVK
jgi:hypothetical protein